MIITIHRQNEDVLSRAEKLLAGMPGKFDAALQSTAKRTLQEIQKNSSKEIRKKYAISDANIRKERNITFRYRIGHGITASILFSSHKIPLHRYEGSGPQNPQVSARFMPVKTSDGWRMMHPGMTAYGHQFKSTSAHLLTGTFVARFKSGHVGIFERTGGVTDTGKDEIHERMGSAVAQMVGNEEVAQPLCEQAMEQFDVRLEQEAERILAGLRG